MTFRSRWLLILLALSLAGCASSSGPRLGTWEGPATHAKFEASPWKTDDFTGEKISTEHYAIFSTLHDKEENATFAQLMEGAYEQYRKLAPVPEVRGRPMECYVFGNRQQWQVYTRAHTGKDAGIYLQINRGGYTIGDRYVIYYLGKFSTSSVAAHEGWHQYVAKNFKGRLPPFLEEGIACMFEQVDWNDGLPQWNLSVNRMRAMALRKAVEGDYLIPLRNLITTHAGEIVRQNNEQIEAFYAQNWAFAKFMWEADGAKYRPALQKLLADTAMGYLSDASGARRMPVVGWDPGRVRPALEFYLGMNFNQIEEAYRQYVNQIAFEEYLAQWDS